jgi:hypothetical protein
MPCSGDDGYSSLYEGEVNKLTQMLCALCRRIEAETKTAVWIDGVIEADPKLKTWWKKHKKADQERQEREAELARKAALAQEIIDKLTPEQRAAMKANLHKLKL